LLTYFREKDWAENRARKESQMLDNQEDKIGGKGRNRTADTRIFSMEHVDLQDVAHARHKDFLRIGL